MTDFKNVSLKEIRPDVNQPRKFYDEVAMAELTASVKEKGILQPILIRPNGKGFILVAGERRFRAATTAGLTDIPAVIRELSDDEALEIQIIENLQRKDVHPMEEAVAFKSLVENKTRIHTVEEVATMVAKTVYFIRQRLKLNSLTKDWQEVFYKNKIHIAVALQISTLAEKEQVELYKAKVNKKNILDHDYHVNIHPSDLERLQRKLKSAPFDKTDVTLNPAMGACTTCPFNSAVNSLFPEDEKDPVCNNSTCFNTKCEVAFNRKLHEVKADPAFILIYNYFTTDEDQKLNAQLKKEGHTVYEVGPECRIISGQKNVKLKGFYIGGHEKGNVVNIELVKKSASGSPAKSVADKVKSGNASLEDINEEIERLTSKEKRSKEIDFTKMWDNLKKHFNPSANSSLLKEDFTAIEREAIANALRSKLSFDERDSFDALFKIKDEIGKVSDVTLRQMTRFFFLDVLPPTSIYNVKDHAAAVCLKIAADYFPSVLKDVTDAQNAIADKRIARVNERLAEMNNKRKELAPKSKPVAKKVAKKKAKK